MDKPTQVVKEVLEEPVQTVLNAYLDLLQLAFPGKIGGLYLHGSAALGGFNPHDSDLDLITVLNSALDENNLDRLDRLHREINTNFPGFRFEVHYLQWADLGKDKKDILPHPYFKYNRLSRAERGHFNPNVWWFMKHSCITLLGPRSEDLPFNIAWETVREWNKQFLQYYWRGWTHKLSNLLRLRNDEVINWSVLGICRLHYNLYQRDIATKEQAGQYALSILPEKYRRIVREALRIRTGEDNGLYLNPLKRAYDAAKFIDYMVQACEENIRVEA